jgi:pyruvate formate lyase activating enzyme
MAKLLLAAKQTRVPMLPYAGRVASEIRPAYFLQAMGIKPLPMAIFSFGRCNFSCRYCKRRGYFFDKQGNIIDSIDVDTETLFWLVKKHVALGNAIRLSGGDPCVFPGISRALLEYAVSLGGVTSIAHNGSSPDFVQLVLPFLHFASIDVKAASPQELMLITGIHYYKKAQRLLENAYITIESLLQHKKPVDVRTTVFADTGLEQLEVIARRLKEVADENPLLFWTLRCYSPMPGFERKPPDIEKIKHYARCIAGKYGIKMGIRSQWEPGGFLFL